MSMNLVFSPKLATFIVQYAMIYRSLTSPTNSEEGDQHTPDSSRVDWAVIFILATGWIVVPITYIYLLAYHPAEVMAYVWTAGEILCVVATISGTLRFWCFYEMGRYHFNLSSAKIINLFKRDLTNSYDIFHSQRMPSH